MDKNGQVSEMRDVVMAVSDWAADKPWIVLAKNVKSIQLLLDRKDDVLAMIVRFKTVLLGLDLREQGLNAEPLEERYIEALKQLGEYIAAFVDYFDELPDMADEKAGGYLQQYEHVKEVVCEIMSIYMAIWLTQANGPVKANYGSPDMLSRLLRARVSAFDVTEHYVTASHSSLIKKSHDYDLIIEELEKDIKLAGREDDFWLYMGLLSIRSYIAKVEHLVAQDGSLEANFDIMAHQNAILALQLDFCRHARMGDVLAIAKKIHIIDNVRDRYYEIVALID
jgi:hypothetical protein